MSTFAGLTTSYTGLSAARAAIELAGQNITNVHTPGYTRQRVDLSANPALGTVGVLALPRSGAGQGVTVTGISRLADDLLTASVRTASAAAGYHASRSDLLAQLEDGLHEPGANGLSAQLQEFWASWQDLGNAAGDGAAAAVVIEEATALASRIGEGYRAVADQWKAARADAAAMVEDVNQAAARVAELNDVIRRTSLGGGSVNELLDERDRVAGDLAALAGGVVHDRGDGTVDVLVAGNPVVAGTVAHRVALAGPTTPGGGPVQLEWERRPGTPIALDGGALAGTVSMLAPASGGSGGPLAEALASYDAFATTLAAQVNAVHRQGVTTTGATGLDFFATDPALPPALGLRVVPTGADGIAAAAPGAGALDGSNADRIAQLAKGAGSPDAVWSAFVARVGVTAGAEHDRAAVTELGRASALARQLSTSSVDLDEENLNLVAAQTAYQGAARVFTAIDEMLDVLVNRTGLVGR
ncbi:flagellar hook-associated protein FlgK [Agromyces sp. G08B096]|uniref:Flagellar hook-associated protein 1 n=1 Tax=Agromyces sp. G08B096 TaxID=3156399 RepID=A0AAU7W6L5_9MICO